MAGDEPHPSVALPGAFSASACRKARKSTGSRQPPKRPSESPRSLWGHWGLKGPLGAKGRPTASDLALSPARERGADSCRANGTPKGCIGSLGARRCRWSRLVVPNHRQTNQIMLILSIVLKISAPSRRERQASSHRIKSASVTRCALRDRTGARLCRRPGLDGALRRR